MSAHAPPFVFDPKRYPAGPGCYLLKDAAGKVLYVGKAVNLRKRLSSYFRPRSRDRRTARLAARVADVEVILVRTEVESLLLENNLIKLYQPPYNRLLKGEDTGYFYIVLTAEELPRLAPYRKGRLNQELGDAPIAQYFGPYASGPFRDRLLQLAVEAFQLRTCQVLPARACLRYHMHKCGGICEARVSAADYAAAVRRATAFLSRPQPALLQQIRQEMMAHADRLEFEIAQRLKERIEALEQTLSVQVVERQVDHDEDVLYFGSEAVLVATVRRGILQGLSLCALEGANGAARPGERFVLSRYARRAPEELIVNDLPDPDAIEQALRQATGRRVRITIPRRGAKVELLALCAQNYAYRTSL